MTGSCEQMPHTGRAGLHAQQRSLVLLLRGTARTSRKGSGRSAPGHAAARDAWFSVDAVSTVDWLAPGRDSPHGQDSLRHQAPAAAGHTMHPDITTQPPRMQLILGTAPRCQASLTRFQRRLMVRHRSVWLTASRVGTGARCSRRLAPRLPPWVPAARRAGPILRVCCPCQKRRPEASPKLLCGPRPPPG